MSQHNFPTRVPCKGNDPTCERRFQFVKSAREESEPLLTYKPIKEGMEENRKQRRAFAQGFLFGAFIAAMLFLAIPAHAATDIPLDPAFRASGFEQTDENINVFARILRGNGWACNSLIQITTFTPGQQWGVVCDHGRHVYRLTLYYGKVLIEPGVF